MGCGFRCTIWVGLQLVSNVVDTGAVRAEKLGAQLSSLLEFGVLRAEELGSGITRELQQASDSLAVQTQVSQESLQVCQACLL